VSEHEATQRICAQPAVVTDRKVDRLIEIVFDRKHDDGSVEWLDDSHDNSKQMKSFRGWLFSHASLDVSKQDARVAAAFDRKMFGERETASGARQDA